MSQLVYNKYLALKKEVIGDYSLEVIEVEWNTKLSELRMKD